MIGMSFGVYATTDDIIHQIEVNIEDEGIIRPKSIQIFPVKASINVTTSFVTVSFTGNLNVDIEVISLDGGGTVYSNSVTATAGDVLPINLNGFDPGMYKIRFVYGNTVLSGEFSLEDLW